MRVRLRHPPPVYAGPAFGTALAPYRAPVALGAALPDLWSVLRATEIGRFNSPGGPGWPPQPPAVRLQDAATILREFQAAGLGTGVGMAAIVNAMKESGLNRYAVGDGGKSVGLFQLHEGGGGKGMSVAQRQDPVLNTRRIIEEYRAAQNKTSGKDMSRGNAVVPMESLSAAYARGATVAEMAGLFGFHVERPYALTAARSEREQAAHKYLGPFASMPARAVDGGAGLIGQAGSALASGASAAADMAGALYWIAPVVVGAGLLALLARRRLAART